MIRSLLHKFTGDRRASISVETALLMTVLIVLAMGVFDFGKVYARKMELTNAVRAGMQYSLVRKPIAGDYSDIIYAVNTGLSSNDQASGSTVSVSMYCKCSDGSDSDCLSTAGSNLTCPDGNLRSAYVYITLEETYTLIFVHEAVGGVMTLSESASVRLN